MEKHYNYNYKYIWLISLVAAMGGLLFGYDWVVIGGAKPFYERYFEIFDLPFLQGLAMSSALLGCLFGAAISGRFTDRYGRKIPLLFAGFLFIFTSIGTGLFNSFVAFMAFRIIGGIAIGIASNISPVYIAEVSPAHMRGKLVAVNQLTIAVGVLSAQLVNMLIAEPVPLDATNELIMNSWNGQMGWRWMFWACAVPAGFFFSLMWIVPESPRWLIEAGKKGKAYDVFSRIGGVEYAADELNEINKSVDKKNEGVVKLSHLFTKALAPIMVLGIFLAVFQQWCGINVIFNYAEEIFSAAGFGISGTLFNIVLTGAISLIFTVIAMFTVDRLGRRSLMLFGAGALSFVYVFVASGYYFHLSGTFMLITVVTAIAVYTFTLAPVTWVLLSEIFPNRVRGQAMSVATFALWLGCAVLTLTFPLLNKYMGTSGTFILYSGICFIGFIFMWVRLPETKQKTLEQIELELTRK